MRNKKLFASLVMLVSPVCIALVQAEDYVPITLSGQVIKRDIRTGAEEPLRESVVTAYVQDVQGEPARMAVDGVSGTNGEFNITVTVPRSQPAYRVVLNARATPFTLGTIYILPDVDCSRPESYRINQPIVCLYTSLAKVFRLRAKNIFTPD